MTIDSADKRVRRDIVTDVERPWIDAVERLGAGAVWEQLRSEGVTAAQAANIVEWLEAQASGRRYRSPDARTAYRKVLSHLTPIMFDALAA